MPHVLKCQICYRRLELLCRILLFALPAGPSETWLAQRMASIVARQNAELAPALHSAVSVFGSRPQLPAAKAGTADEKTCINPEHGADPVMFVPAGTGPCPTRPRHASAGGVAACRTCSALLFSLRVDLLCEICRCTFMAALPQMLSSPAGSPVAHSTRVQVFDFDHMYHNH